MASWVRCTSEDGDTVHLNFRYAMSIHRNDQMKLTYIHMLGEPGERAIKETVDELRKLGVDF